MNTSTVHCTCSTAGPHVIGAMNMELKLPPLVPVYKPTDYFIVLHLVPDSLNWVEIW
jgi:hypothetical protein